MISPIPRRFQLGGEWVTIFFARLRRRAFSNVDLNLPPQCLRRTMDALRTHLLNVSGLHLNHKDVTFRDSTATAMVPVTQSGKEEKVHQARRPSAVPSYQMTKLPASSSPSIASATPPVDLNHYRGKVIDIHPVLRRKRPLE